MHKLLNKTWYAAVCIHFKFVNLSLKWLSPVQKISRQPGRNVVPFEHKNCSFPWVEKVTVLVVVPLITTTGRMMTTESLLIMMMTMMRQMIISEELSLPQDWRTSGRGLQRHLVWYWQAGGRVGNFFFFGVSCWNDYLCLCLNEKGVMKVCRAVMRKSSNYGKRHNLEKESGDVQESR